MSTSRRREMIVLTITNERITRSIPKIVYLTISLALSTRPWSPPAVTNT